MFLYLSGFNNPFLYNMTAIKNCGCSDILDSMFNAQRWGFVLFVLLLKLPRLFLFNTKGALLFLEDQQGKKCAGL